MGRPRVYDEPRVATAIRLPVSLRERVHAMAAERNISVNLLVTRAVTDYVQRVPPAGAGEGPGGAVGAS